MIPYLSCHHSVISPRLSEWKAPSASWPSRNGLIAAGKDVIELEIGDSPFSTPPKAIEAGVQAIRDGHSRYGPSLGIMEFREAAAEYVNREYGFRSTGENVVAGPGAKNFEQLFCEAFLNPGDGVLIFSPHFPTYPPEHPPAQRAGGHRRALKASNEFRPEPGRRAPVSGRRPGRRGRSS